MIREEAINVSIKWYILTSYLIFEIWYEIPYYEMFFFKKFGRLRSKTDHLKYRMDSSHKHNEQNHADEGSVSSMKINQTNLDLPVDHIENEHHSKGKNPEDSTKVPSNEKEMRKNLHL